MKVLLQKFPGSTILCNKCQWFLAYEPADIYQNKYIYCPNPDCREKIEVALDLSYDGLKEEPTA